MYKLFALLILATLYTISANANEKLTLMLDWTPNTNHTGIYVAQHQGWYKQAGVELQTIIAAETEIHKAVATGAADIGISYQEGLTLARAEGIPVVSIATIIQHNTSAFASRVEKNIRTPADFAEKKYGGFGSPVEKPMLDLLMMCYGKSADSVRIVDVGWADFLKITENDRIDFSWIFYGWTGIDAELKGVPINTIMLKDHLDCIPDYYTPIFIASEKIIKQRPSQLRKFVAATARGYDFAIANPKQAAAILLAANKELDSALVHKSQQWLSKEYQADAKQWGVQKKSIWKNYANFLIANKIISKFNSDTAFTNEFLPNQ